MGHKDFINTPKEQPFEKHERLTELLGYAALHWKVDVKWSELLYEINKLCNKIDD